MVSSLKSSELICLLLMWSSPSSISAPKLGLRYVAARYLFHLTYVAIPISIHSEPTVFENYVHDVHVGEQVVELSLWDTAGMKQPWFVA